MRADHADADSEIRAEAEAGSSANAHALHAASQEALFHERLSKWQSRNDTDTVQDRLNTSRYLLPLSHREVTPETSPAPSTVDAMAASVRSRSTAASKVIVAARLQRYHGPPSMVTDTTLRSSSPARTDRADSIISIGFLQQQYNNLLIDPEDEAGNMFACCFGFLACKKTFDELDAWDDHCKAHFHGHLFESVQCPFHCAWAVTRSTGEQAWAERVLHIVDEHHGERNVDVGRKPDTQLLEHLLRNSIISTLQYKDLRQHGCIKDEPYLVVGKSRHDQRRRRGVHVPPKR